VSVSVDDELVEAVAQRTAELVLERLAAAPAPRRARAELVDAHAVAEALGVAASWVRGHAAELGGVPLGDGERPRWRFDLARAIELREASACLASRRSLPADPAVDGGSEPPRRRRRSAGAQLGRSGAQTTPLLRVGSKGEMRRAA